MNKEKRENFSRYTPREEYFYQHDREQDQDTGPEGLRDYRPHLIQDPRAVGIGDVSREQSLDTAYLLRPAPGATLERPRSCRPGEVGWGVPWLVDWSPANSGQQIMLGDFRQIAEDRATHENTGAWYPHPEQPTPPGSDGYYKENIFSGRPGTDDVALPSFSANRPDSSQGVCAAPVDCRPPARLRTSARNHDTAAPPLHTAAALSAAATSAAVPGGVVADGNDDRDDGGGGGGRGGCCSGRGDREGVPPRSGGLGCCD